MCWKMTEKDKEILENSEPVDKRLCVKINSNKIELLTGYIESDKKESSKIKFLVDGWPSLIFDKEGFKLFVKEFWNCNKGYNVLMLSPYITLLRELKPSGLEKKYFHRVFMRFEIYKESKKRNCKFSDLHVHHINQSHFDNRKENLKIIHKDEHVKEHSKWADSWAEYQKRRDLGISYA